MGEEPTSGRRPAAGAVGEVSRRTASNMAASGIAELVGKVATLALTLVAARALSRADFGALAYAFSFSLLVAALPAWGFDALLVKRASASPPRLASLLGEIVTLRTMIAVPVLAVAGLVGISTRPTTRAAVALVLIMIATMIDLYSSAGRAAAASLQRQHGVALALVGQRILTALFSVAAIIGGLGLVGIATAYLVGSVLGALGVLVAVSRLGVGIDFRSVTRGRMADTGRRSVALGIDALVAMVLFRVDAVLLSAIKGDEAVANYSTAYRLVETVLFIAWAVAAAVFPVMSRAKEPWRVRRGVEQGMAVASLVYGAFAVMMVIDGAGILRLLFGRSYAEEGFRALQWLSVAPLAFALGYLLSYALLSRDRTKVVVMSSVIAAGFNIVLNLVLIPRMAGTGAAIATTSAYVLEAVILVVFAVPVLGKMRLAGSVVLPFVAALAMAATLVLLPLPVLADGAAGGAVYLVVWYFLARRWSPHHLELLAGLVPWTRIPGLRRSPGPGAFRSTSNDDARPLNSRRVPVVLMHHGFTVSEREDPYNLFVTESRFRSQLDMLVARRWPALDLDAYLAAIENGPSARRSFLITIDDGFTSAVDIGVRLLAERGIPALLFVPPALLGKQSSWMPDAAGEAIIDADRARSLQSMGIELGVHGLDHAVMTGMTDAELLRHTREAREILGDILGRAPRAFAYPEGLFDERARRAVRDAGFTVAFSVHRDAGRFAISRVDVNATDDDRTFRLKLIPGYRQVWRATSLVRGPVHRMLDRAGGLRR